MHQELFSMLCQILVKTANNRRIQIKMPPEGIFRYFPPVFAGTFSLLTSCGVNFLQKILV